jgi:hypothetical protein
MITSDVFLVPFKSAALRIWTIVVVMETGMYNFTLYHCSIYL